jgi:signal transduction histidine kinase
MNNQISPREQKLSNIVNNAPVGIAQIDNHGNLLELNLEGERLLFPLVQAYNLQDNNLFSRFEPVAPDACASIREAPGVPGIIFINAEYSFELPGMSSEPGRYCYNITASRLDPECIIVAFEDITAQHLKEQDILQALTDKAIALGKTAMAADILHDIGNAIVGMGAFLTRIRKALEQDKGGLLDNIGDFFSAQHAALETALGPQKAKATVDMLRSLAANRKEVHEDIRTAANGQLALINHIQEILAIQRQYVAGQETRERSPVNLRAVVTDCQSMLAATMDKRGIKLVTDLGAESPLINGDRTKLMQVIMNLLKNGIEAIDIQCADKHIRTELRWKGSQLVLQIEDSGCGFDEATAGKLFDRGFTTKSSGTGLGLYNCREIVESHSGSMAITSQGPGKGAVITITFNPQK